LTIIRCAIVEGGHHCEAACWVLQGYEVGEPIPLEQKGINLPQKGTLFTTVPTQVYYCLDDNLKLDQNVLKYLREISEKIAAQKNLIIQPTWHTFLEQVLKDINDQFILQTILYNNAKAFFGKMFPTLV